MQSVRKISSGLFLAGVLLLNACAPTEPEASNANGTVERLVSLAPSITEVVFALGAEGQLVGRSNYCDFPVGATAVESVGRIDMPNLERIVSLEPDLVVMTDLTPLDTMTRLEDLGLRVLRLRADRLEDISETFMRLGALLNLEAEAKERTDALKGRLADLTAKGAGFRGERPRACLLYGVEPPYFSAGEGTFPSALLARAGFKNIADEAPLAWPQLNLEWLIQQDPEVIFLATGGDGVSVAAEWARWRSSKVWNQVSAVRAGRVYGIGDDALSVPGLRALKALQVFSDARAEFP